MKLSITIECDDFEEYKQVSQLLTRQHNIDVQTQETLQPRILKELEKINNKDDVGERFIPLTKWNEYHEWPSTSGLRHLVFYEDTNGFHKCVKRVGRRVLIDEKAFFEWLKSK